MKMRRKRLRAHCTYIEMRALGQKAAAAGKRAAKGRGRWPIFKAEQGSDDGRKSWS